MSFAQLIQQVFIILGDENVAMNETTKIPDLVESMGLESIVERDNCS